MMKVYIVEGGEYEQRYTAGVFDTPERAMAAFPGHWTRELWLNEKQYSQQWASEKYTIYEEDFIDSGPETPPDVIQRQRPDPEKSAHGGWFYDTITADEAETFLDTAWAGSAVEGVDYWDTERWMK